MGKPKFPGTKSTDLPEEEHVDYEDPPEWLSKVGNACIVYRGLGDKLEHDFDHVTLSDAILRREAGKDLSEELAPSPLTEKRLAKIQAAQDWWWSKREKKIKKLKAKRAKAPIVRRVREHSFTERVEVAFIPTIKRIPVCKSCGSHYITLVHARWECSTCGKKSNICRYLTPS